MAEGLSAMYVIILPALGFFGAALIGDFLKWRSDIRKLHIEKLDQIAHTIEAVIDVLVRQIGSNTRDEIHDSALRLYSLVGLYLPVVGNEARNLVQSVYDFQSANLDATATMNDETMTNDQKKERIKELLSGPRSEISTSLDQIGRALQSRHLRLQKWLVVP